jgi:hypothetical protein
LSEELVFEQACPWPDYWIKEVEFSGNIQHGRVTIDVEAKSGPARIGEFWGDKALQWISEAGASGQAIPWHFVGAPFPGFGMIINARLAQFMDPLFGPSLSSRMGSEDMLLRMVPHPNPPMQGLALEAGAVDAEIIDV